MAEGCKQVAIARVLRASDLADPERLRRVEAHLLDSVELRRCHEEQESGKRFRLVHLGFRRYHEGRVIECRANLVEFVHGSLVFGERGLVLGANKDGPKDWSAPPPDVSADRLVEV
jgi:hypothetical protein